MSIELSNEIIPRSLKPFISNISKILGFSKMAFYPKIPITQHLIVQNQLSGPFSKLEIKGNLPRPSDQALVAHKNPLYVI